MYSRLFCACEPPGHLRPRPATWRHGTRGLLFFPTGVLRPLARGRPLCVVLSGTLLLQRQFLFENTVVVAFVLLALVNHF